MTIATFCSTDISHYIKILAENVSDGTTTSGNKNTQLLSSGNNSGNGEAGEFVPGDEEWDCGSNGLRALGCCRAN